MFEIRFYLNRFFISSCITDKGIYSLNILRICNNTRDFTIAESLGEETEIRKKHFKTLINHLSGYFSGDTDIFRAETDFEGFSEREMKIFRHLMNVPSGHITTYGALAKHALGNNANRYVGRALSRNRLQLIVPCHRVVMKDLKIGGFTSHLGLKLKILLLQSEGITVKNNKIEHCRIYSF